MSKLGQNVSIPISLIPCELHKLEPLNGTGKQVFRSGFIFKVEHDRIIITRNLLVSTDLQVSWEVLQCSSEQHRMGKGMNLNIWRTLFRYPQQLLPGSYNYMSILRRWGITFITY